MDFQFSERANHFKPNIFNVLSERKAKVIEKGVKVYDLFVGTPDFPPAPHVIEAYIEAAKDTENYKYSLVDTKELKESVIRWYKRRYDVDLTDEEIFSVAGSQEGIAHVAMTVCNPGDLVLAPNPGYPIFADGPYINGAEVEYYELDKDKNFEPMLHKIDEETAKRAKMIVVSYPLNPTCTCASREFYEELIEFANKYNILVVHDNAYSEIVYDGKKGISFLSLPGAKEVGIEFNSLSKTYNLTGIRISFAVGNAKVINKFKTVRSQFDYGTSYIVQKAAIAALDGPQDIVAKQCEIYQSRRDALCDGLNSIGWKVPYSQGTMFVWAPIPEGFESSDDFCIQMLENTGVLCTPGSAFGSKGEGYVRFALVLDTETIKTVVSLIGNWLNL